MIIRALDSNKDWTYGKGKNDYNSGNNAAQELINTRLYSFLGDCFFDMQAGIDWFNFMSSKNQIGLDLAVSATILNTPDENGNQLVTGLKQLSIVLNQDTRNITIQYSCITIFSSVTGQLSFDLNGSS